MPRKIEIQVVGNTRDLERALARAGKTTQSSFQKIGKAAGLAGLALGGVLALGAKAGFDELAQGQKVSAQTAAVLKSTGNAANVTAKQVESLSAALMEKSGVDDEVIQSGANLLLTFKNIRNGVEEDEKFFDQATKAALDLSVALGKDMPSAALMVGKALNDPIRGLTALGRAGVQFTDAQKDMIKEMVKNGEIMDAQEVILAELESQVGGSAEAFGKTLPGQLAIARESFTNLAAELMTSLLPAFNSVAAGLSGLFGFLTRHKTLTKNLVIGLGALAAALMTVSVATKVYTAATKVATVATVLFAAAQRSIPLVRVALLIVALGVAIVAAYKKSETFRNIVKGAFNVALQVVVAFKNTVVAMKNTVVSAFNAVVSTIKTVVSWLITAWNWLSKIAGKVWNIKVSLPDPTPGFDVPGIPGFASGGVVPGRRGAPKLIMAHGGETVLPTHRGGAASSGGGGGGQFALIWAGSDFISWMRQQNVDYGRRNGGKGILG